MSDHGSEVIGAALVDGLPGVGAKPIAVAAGCPWEKGDLESVQSRLRAEFVGREEFESVADARAKGSWYRRAYNTVRPDSAVGDPTPKEFSAACEGEGNGQRRIIIKR